MIWHPIETIPKDGRKVLVYDNMYEARAEGNYVIVSFSEDDNHWDMPEGGIYCSDGQFDEGSVWCSLSEPPVSIPEELIHNE